MVFFAVEKGSTVPVLLAAVLLPTDILKPLPVCLNELDVCCALPNA